MQFTKMIWDRAHNLLVHLTRSSTAGEQIFNLYFFLFLYGSTFWYGVSIRSGFSLNDLDLMKDLGSSYCRCECECESFYLLTRVRGS